jgi:uncharacterized membrane protein
MTQAVQAADQPVTKRQALVYLPTWLAWLIGGLALFNGLPFLAPLFMKLGWTIPAQAIYFTYGFLCHQMAQRSFFLFGPQGFQMYGVDQFPVEGNAYSIALALRAFTGNPELGWKVAWSDRMVSTYGSPLLAALLYAGLRPYVKIKPMALWLFFLLMLPIGIDGFSHMLSDFAGIGQGFRDSNEWLAVLTHHAFPASFYAGDELGSFNSEMRLITGLIFGFAVTWLTLPYIDMETRRPEEIE